jgi:hypothetical protein
MELLEFVGLLGFAVAEIEHGNREALDQAGQIVEDAAKEAMGTHTCSAGRRRHQTIARKSIADSHRLNRENCGTRSVTQSSTDTRATSDPMIRKPSTASSARRRSRLAPSSSLRRWKWSRRFSGSWATVASGL